MNAQKVCIEQARGKQKENNGTIAFDGTKRGEKKRNNYLGRVFRPGKWISSKVWKGENESIRWGKKE